MLQLVIVNNDPRKYQVLKVIAYVGSKDPSSSRQVPKGTLLKDQDSESIS